MLKGVLAAARAFVVAGELRKSPPEAEIRALRR
jgi:hypothetical protein